MCSIQTISHKLDVEIQKLFMRKYLKLDVLNSQHFRKALYVIILVGPAQVG